MSQRKRTATEAERREFVQKLGRFRETLTISGPRGTRRPASRVHFYLIRSGTRTARHKARPRLRRVGPGRFRAAATLRFLAPRRSTIVLACYREPTPDPWGRASEIDPVCGRRRLTLSAPARAATANATAATPDATPRFAAN